MIDTQGSSSETVGVNRSSANPEEAKFILRLERDMAQTNVLPEEIVTLVGYHSQLTLLNNLAAKTEVSEKLRRKWTQVQRFVVGGFIGNDAHVIIYGITRTENLGYQRPKRFFRTAVTRPKSCLIVVSSYQDLRKIDSGDAINDAYERPYMIMTDRGARVTVDLHNQDPSDNAANPGLNKNWAGAELAGWDDAAGGPSAGGQNTGPSSGGQTAGPSSGGQDAGPSNRNNAATDDGSTAHLPPQLRWAAKTPPSCTPSCRDQRRWLCRLQRLGQAHHAEP